MNTRRLGLDIGDRKIGVALSDPGGILASPLTIIRRSDNQADVAALIEVIAGHQVGQIVVGLPRSMDGSIGTQAEKVITFTEELSRHTDVPVDFRDERLSTVSARRLLRMGRKTKGKIEDDAAAAAVILQSYLDEHSG